MFNSCQMGQFAVIDFQNGQINGRLNYLNVQTILNESVFVRFKGFAGSQQLYIFAIIYCQLLYVNQFCELNVSYSYSSLVILKVLLIVLLMYLVLICLSQATKFINSVACYSVLLGPRTSLKLAQVGYY
ncbi:Hypothetical_protein [Hexamita inflata]|uniref:Hypothetical_protein n=1 Tax=Hexamita inflata TaxID=28002 RepID=A0AA86RFX3_9EUKA|nr:Hypothetical protein HINF_LOCUS15342 [Hexamita inflata]CAI9972573.1 Hypothetical protein HINF_LOCUS60218 [Hexamita inflata]